MGGPFQEMAATDPRPGAGIATRRLQAVAERDHSKENALELLRWIERGGSSVTRVS